jgi:AcrR family transcriptional regulator
VNEVVPGAGAVKDDPGRRGAVGQPPAPRRPGRPRSARADQAIIDAALSLFAESGPDGLCIEKVAARAGVGKATIYRRWAGKEDLLLDAMASLKAPLPQPAGQAVRADLVELIGVLCQDAADPRRAREFALLLGEGAKYPRLMARYVETVVEPRREVVRSVLRRGITTGELRADTDVDAALFMLIGAVLARGKFDPESIPPGYAERIVDELLAGLAPR